MLSTDRAALITIVVPVYNVEKYLNRCVESIVGQTYGHLDIVLVDDGSKDASDALCDEWVARDDRVRVVHKQNQGLGFARNTGIEHAKGQYVQFVDSDDFLADDAVERLYEATVREGADTVYCGWMKYVDEGTILRHVQPFGGRKFVGNDRIIQEVLPEIIGTNPDEKEDSYFSMSACHAMYSLDLLRASGVAFHSEREMISEDLVFHIDYLRHAQCVFVLPDCLYYYRYNRDSLTTSWNPNRMDREVVLFMHVKEMLGEFLSEDRYLLRLQRMFLGRVRSNAMRCLKKPGAVGEIKRICSNGTVVSVLKTYPYWKNPLRHRVFNFFVKHQVAWAVRVFAELGYRKALI